MIDDIHPRRRHEETLRPSNDGTCGICQRNPVPPGRMFCDSCGEIKAGLMRLRLQPRVIAAKLIAAARVHQEPTSEAMRVARILKDCEEGAEAHGR